jgi:hypothetical protein
VHTDREVRANRSDIVTETMNTDRCGNTCRQDFQAKREGKKELKYNS